MNLAIVSHCLGECLSYSAFRIQTTGNKEQGTMNILITGIHGFVGSNLVKALSNQHQLYGIDIIKPDREGVVATFNLQDLLRERLIFEIPIQSTNHLL